MKKEQFVYVTYIRTTPAKLWQALLQPKFTRQFWCDLVQESDWKPGSPLIWKGTFNGVEMIAVKGNIVSIEPPGSLVYTVIDPNNPKIPDLPENYLTITCDLAERDGQTTLEVSQGDYSTVAEGESRYQHTVEGGGWDPILVQIKALCES